MDTGTYISGAVHALAVAWVLLGGALFNDADDIPPAFTTVTMITEEELSALSTQSPSPIEVPEAPALPVVPDDTADTPSADARPETPVPDPVAPSQPDDTPRQPLSTPPVALLPETPVEPPAPTPEPDAPVVADEPRPRPVPRVAETPQLPSPPDAVEDELRQSATEPAPSPEQVTEAQEETAPPEAATEIVTEAEVAAAAPTRTTLPLRRPARPTPTPQPQSDQLAEAIAGAVAEAAGSQSSAPNTSAPVGPPLTGGEKDGLRLAVQRCWNVGSLSTEALQVTVTLGVDMAEDGTPIGGSIRMLEFAGGSQAAAEQAFEAARRAVIRCGARGFDLPVEKYSHWREIEMVFNPEKMRIK